MGTWLKRCASSGMGKGPKPQKKSNRSRSADLWQRRLQTTGATSAGSPSGWSLTLRNGAQVLRRHTAAAIPSMPSAISP